MRGPSARPRLFPLTWPLLLELLLGIGIGIIGTGLAARLSDNSGAAFGIANQVFAALFVLFRVIGAGVSVAVTQALGAGRRELPGTGHRLLDRLAGEDAEHHRDPAGPGDRLDASGEDYEGTGARGGSTNSISRPVSAFWAEKTLADSRASSRLGVRYRKPNHSLLVMNIMSTTATLNVSP